MARTKPLLPALIGAVVSGFIFFLIIQSGMGPGKGRYSPLLHYSELCSVVPAAIVTGWLIGRYSISPWRTWWVAALGAPFLTSAGVFVGTAIVFAKGNSFAFCAAVAIIAYALLLLPIFFVESLLLRVAFTLLDFRRANVEPREPAAKELAARQKS